jgi:hypothetical protein
MIWGLMLTRSYVDVPSGSYEPSMTVLLPPPPPPPQQYVEDYPFSPTTPQDLQFLSVASFPGHNYEYEDYLSQAYQQPAEDVAQEMTEPERDPLLSMLAEMAERDGFEGGSEDVWMGGGEEN